MSGVVSFQLLGKRGRLGNALFQAASTIGLARTHGLEPRFNADWPHRRVFSVPDEYFESAPADAVDPAALILDGIAKPSLNDTWRSEFLQDRSLFIDSASNLRSCFRPSALGRDIMDEDPSVDAFRQLPRPILGIHVRRGDNVPGQDPGVPDKQKYWPLPPLAYYMEAMEVVRDHAGEWRSVAVFSDDIEWCRRHIPADYYRVGRTMPKEHEAAYRPYLRGESMPMDWIDLQLLSECNAFVLSNSTFGLWGAYLANGFACVPHPWCGPRLAYIDARIMYPDGWTVLDFESRWRLTRIGHGEPSWAT